MKDLKDKGGILQKMEDFEDFKDKLKCVCNVDAICSSLASRSRSCSAKEFFSTEGAVGLLTWFESIESVLHITQPLEDFKKLIMEDYCPDEEIQKLKSEFWNHKMLESDIDKYTARFQEVNDGIFKKKENAGNKRRLKDQSKNRGKNDKNKRQRTRKNFAITASEQEPIERQYTS
ncbi:hypothetical protein Tco_1093618 [Tanacetum coccineum]|uniref:Retrotransposon gag domain-containing protein n=1 Tax=Tanacetum coccineum TaxID=301880 RepID=A0ABQ5IEH3_9ASTR